MGKKIKVSDATPLQLDWLVAKAQGYEVMLFDQLWRDNAALKGYPPVDVEQHLQWQPQKGQQIIVELRLLQLDQRNPEILTPTRCAVDIPNYSTDWSQAGPIIEREGISLLYLYVTDDPFRWAATQKPSIKNLKPNSIYGPTLIIAAMRCFCASRLGDEVEIP